MARKLGLDSVVQLPEGKLSTIREILDSGRGHAVQVEHFQSRRKVRRAWFVDLVDETEDGSTKCYEVLKSVYRSRQNG